ncbi:cytochrome c1 [Ferrimonas balearica]|uniref:cytochrome c1 n=1 Tax=Ferrimonas balearica TaxID=44012 RepID=UPI001C997902|nr:cytochrome c1 [Ferrimonas balearica]MBY5922451.1 cytochrome c1 [Ferrimonas balearica]MBY5995435.1 cytochrome c1 [Ferrimonas balearica]
MKKFIIAIIAALPALSYAAGGNNEHVVPANIDLADQASLQRGAVAFMENCSGCHSTQYQRYQRVADDIGFTTEQMRELIYTDAKIGDLMTSAIPQADAEKWFGAAPPDLTMVARVRGSDWVYSYLKNFYADPNRPFGVNNLVFPSVGMPHVLESYQGVPVLQEDGTIVSTGGSMTADEYDQLVLDITNFLTYSAEPIRLQRESMGKWVLGFLAVFFVLAYLLKREYWRDVH